VDPGNNWVLTVGCSLVNLQLEDVNQFGSYEVRFSGRIAPGFLVSRAQIRDTEDRRVRFVFLVLSGLGLRSGGRSGSAGPDDITVLMSREIFHNVYINSEG